MTLLLAAVAVPLNVAFGTVAAVLLTRSDFPGKVLLLALLDLPFSISPVVTGLMLTLLYGRAGWFGGLGGPSVVFAFPGMALATVFVTLPFVVREVMPILEAADPAEEEAARSLGAGPLQVFWHVTLPNIRWGLLYGLILTNARAMGEFGAVSVISGAFFFFFRSFDFGFGLFFVALLSRGRQAWGPVLVCSPPSAASSTLIHPHKTTTTTPTTIPRL